MSWAVFFCCFSLSRFKGSINIGEFRRSSWNRHVHHHNWFRTMDHHVFCTATHVVHWLLGILQGESLKNWRAIGWVEPQRSDRAPYNEQDFDKWLQEKVAGLGKEITTMVFWEDWPCQTILRLSQIEVLKCNIQPNQSLEVQHSAACKKKRRIRTNADMSESCGNLEGWLRKKSPAPRMKAHFPDFTFCVNLGIISPTTPPPIDHAFRSSHRPLEVAVLSIWRQKWRSPFPGFKDPQLHIDRVIKGYPTISHVKGWFSLITLSMCILGFKRSVCGPARVIFFVQQFISRCFCCFFPWKKSKNVLEGPLSLAMNVEWKWCSESCFFSI